MRNGRKRVGRALLSREAARTVLIALCAGSLLAAPPLDAGQPATPGPSTSSSWVPVVRVFSLRNRRAEEAVLLVRPLLSDSGSVALESKLNTLTVRDVPGAVDRAAQAISSYDVPPRAVSLSVTLLKASSDPSTATRSTEPGPSIAAPPVRVSDQIKGVGETIKSLFNVKSYTALDAVVVQGTEGDSVAYAIGGEYRLEFVLEPSGSDAVMRLKSLVLFRLKREGAREVRKEVLRTSINVQVGQPYVLGLGRDETASSGALFIVFNGAFQVAGPGIVGVR